MGRSFGPRSPARPCASWTVATPWRASVSAAARAAHLSQPAVTQAVAQVEAALGARLLHRSYSGLELTGAGRAAAQRVDRALQMLREALGAVRTRSANAAYADVLR